MTADREMTYVLYGDGEFVAARSPSAAAAPFEAQDVAAGLYHVVREDGVEYRPVVTGTMVEWLASPGPRHPELFQEALDKRLKAVGLAHYGLPDPPQDRPWTVTANAILAQELAIRRVPSARGRDRRRHA